MKRLMDSVIRSEVVGLSGVGAETRRRIAFKKPWSGDALAFSLMPAGRGTLA